MSYLLRHWCKFTIQGKLSNENPLYEQCTCVLMEVVDMFLFCIQTHTHIFGLLERESFSCVVHTHTRIRTCIVVTV